VSTSTQLAANSPSKPAYGPRFETSPKPPSKAELAKKASAPDDQPAKKQAPAKEEAGKSEASARKGEAAKKLASKEEPSKPGAKKEQASKSGVKKEEPAAKQPSRHWVQIAGGANEAAMTREFLRLKAKAPKLLATRTAWTTPLRATNRLLVGPFKSSEEAQDFVNELAKLDLPAFSWTSPAGQEILKLASK
jgi:hypothetical protein